MVNGEADAMRAPDDRPPFLLRYGRPVIAGLLLLIVIAGIRAASPAVTSHSPWREYRLATAIGLEVALAGVQVMLAVRHRRSQRASRLAVVLRRDLRRVTTIIMIAVAVLAVADASSHDFGQLSIKSINRVPRRRPTAQVPKLRAPVRPGAPVNLTYLGYAIVALLVLAAVVVCLRLIARMPARTPGGYLGEAEHDGAELSHAVESGRAALLAADDARAAIIACYVAMEGSLATAGTPRAAAETPDELLARAAASGLIRGPAAQRLTGLFYEARFSTHVLPVLAKEDARQALDAISAELRSRADAVPAADPASPADEAATRAAR